MYFTGKQSINIQLLCRHIDLSSIYLTLYRSTVTIETIHPTMICLLTFSAHFIHLICPQHKMHRFNSDGRELKGYTNPGPPAQLNVHCV